MFVKKSVLFGSASAFAFLLSACTQQPVEIVYRGSEVYGRSSEYSELREAPQNQTFSSDAPRYKPDYVKPAEPARVPVVAVSDLPPPDAHVTVSNAKSVRIQDSEPAAGGRVQHEFGSPESASHAPVKEQQVASISAEDSQPAHKAATETTSGSNFIWPVDGGKILSRFKEGKGSDGISIAMGEGEPIMAAADGEVVYASNDLKGYGNMVIIRHKGGWMTAYAHARSLTVKKGAKVNQSDLIGYVGSTGDVKTPQVHFALRKGKTPVDPEKYLPNAG